MTDNQADWLTGIIVLASVYCFAVAGYILVWGDYLP